MGRGSCCSQGLATETHAAYVIPPSRVLATKLLLWCTLLFNTLLFFLILLKSLMIKLNCQQKTSLYKPDDKNAGFALTCLSVGKVVNFRQNVCEVCGETQHYNAV